MGKQNDKLFKNIELYEQKEKIKQQESKILGQEPVKRTTNKEKNRADFPLKFWKLLNERSTKENSF